MKNLILENFYKNYWLKTLAIKKNIWIFSKTKNFKKNFSK